MSNKHNGLTKNDGRTLSVGHGNYVSADRVVAILESHSLPMKRLREKATQENLLVDATAGRKTRSIVVLDSRHVVLSAIVPATLQERLLGGGTSPPGLSQLAWEEGVLVS